MKRAVALCLPIAAIAAALLESVAFAQNYRFPLELPGAGEQQPYITAYRDLAAGGGLQDWNCGTNTYDGHRGTDIGIGGFPVMDAGSRWIVAGAPGTVAFVSEGCFDRCTTADCNCGAGFGNYVKVTHADGKSTFYGHMMMGSVQVALNDTVTCGQRLGKVGSSGFSTGPHLHFEPRYSDNTSDDPFSGPCGGPLSYWVEQGAYNSLPGTLCEGEPMPTPEGAIKGVVWDVAVTPGPNDTGNVRLPATVISIEGGPTTTARDGDAYWTFTLAPATYRVTAAIDGYESITKEVVVVQGQDSWASFGLTPEMQMPPPPVEVDDVELVGESEDPILVDPGEQAEKSWTLRNIGTSTWGPSHHLEFLGGERFGTEPVIALSATVAPGAEHTITLLLTSSTTPGVYEGAWTLARDVAGPFGPPLDVDVAVRDPRADPPLKDPPNDDPDPMDDAPTVGDHVQGGCRCATQPANRSWAVEAALLLAAGISLRTRARAKRPARSPRA